VPLIADRLAALGRDDIIARLEEAGVPCGPVNRISDVFATEQVRARGMKISMPHPLAGSGAVNLIGNPVKFSATPVSYRRPPPLCGEHTAEILREIQDDDAGAEK